MINEQENQDALILGMTATVNRQAAALRELSALVVTVEQDRDGWKKEAIEWRTGAKEAKYMRENQRLNTQMDDMLLEMQSLLIVVSNNSGSPVYNEGFRDAMAKVRRIVQPIIDQYQ